MDGDVTDDDSADVVRRTHVLAQRLNRPSVDLGVAAAAASSSSSSCSSPKRTRNSVSWRNPESVESPTKRTLPVPVVRPEVGSSASSSSSSSFPVRDVIASDGGRGREFVLSPIDEDDMKTTTTETGSRLPSPATVSPPVVDGGREPRRNAPRRSGGPLVVQDSVVGSRRLTLPSLIKVPAEPSLDRVDGTDVVVPVNASISKGQCRRKGQKVIFRVSHRI